jgi:hypothetical protein
MDTLVAETGEADETVVGALEGAAEEVTLGAAETTGALDRNALGAAEGVNDGALLGDGVVLGATEPLGQVVAMTDSESIVMIPSTANRGPVELPAPTVMDVCAITEPTILLEAPRVTAAPTFHQTFSVEEAEFTITTFTDAPKVMAVPTLKIQKAFALFSASRVMTAPAATDRAAAMEYTPDLKVTPSATEMIVPVPRAVASALAAIRSFLACTEAAAVLLKVWPTDSTGGTFP